MDKCKGSTPERRQGKIRSVMCWLRATAVSGWRWGIYLLHGIPALKRRIVVCLHRYWLLLFGGPILLFAICIQHFYPQWPVYVVQYLQENLLVGGTVAFLLLFLVVWKLPKWQVANIPDEKDRLATESGFRQTLVQIVGGAALLGGLYFTAQTLRTSQETLQINQKTLETTQQGQITERFTRAIEQLGDKERLMIRLGGIYALERIARDSDRDHWAVMEVLTAFVREQASATTMPPDKAPKERKTKESLPEWKLPSDIQAILTVIGRRTRTFRNRETQRLNLRNTNLQGATLASAQLQGATLASAQLQDATLVQAQLQQADLFRADLFRADLQEANLQQAALQGANLQGANLRQAHLRWANLQGANLQGAYLQGAYLQFAALGSAQLQGANLVQAQLQQAVLFGADLQQAALFEANLQGAYLQRANLQQANLTGAKNLTQDQVNTACVDEHTQLPEGLTRPAPCSANP